MDDYLHPQDQAYTVSTLMDLINAANLRTTSFMYPYAYEPKACIESESYDKMTWVERAQFAELIAGNMIKHLVVLNADCCLYTICQHTVHRTAVLRTCQISCSLFVTLQLCQHWPVTLVSIMHAYRVICDAFCQVFMVHKDNRVELRVELPRPSEGTFVPLITWRSNSSAAATAVHGWMNRSNQVSFTFQGHTFNFPLPKHSHDAVRLFDGHHTIDEIKSKLESTDITPSWFFTTKAI